MVKYKKSNDMQTFDFLVFIGRFQPFHIAHLETVQIALTQAQKVILCLGSAQPERNLKNPFLVTERERMILANFTSEQQQRLIFVPIIDVYNDVKWQALVREKVASYTTPQAKIGLIGYMKDESSYYLDLFPEWQKIALDSLHNAISATPLRQSYYRGEIPSAYLPQGTIDFLVQFQKTDEYQQLQQEFYQIQG